MKLVCFWMVAVLLFFSENNHCALVCGPTWGRLRLLSSWSSGSMPSSFSSSISLRWLSASLPSCCSSTSMVSSSSSSSQGGSKSLSAWKQRVWYWKKTLFWRTQLDKQQSQKEKKKHHLKHTHWKRLNFLSFTLKYTFKKKFLWIICILQMVCEDSWWMGTTQSKHFANWNKDFTFLFFLNPQANIFHTGILVFSGFICVSYPLIQFPLLWSFCSSKYCYSQPVSHAKHHNRCLTNLNTSLQKILSVL